MTGEFIIESAGIKARASTRLILAAPLGVSELSVRIPSWPQ